MEEPALPTGAGRAQCDGVAGLHSEKEGFEFAEMRRRTHENVLAEILEKVLAYNISQIIRVRKKLSERQETERCPLGRPARD